MFKRNIIKLMQKRDERLSTLFLGAFRAQSNRVRRLETRLDECEARVRELCRSDLDSVESEVESESLLVKDLRDQIVDLRERILRDQLFQPSRNAPESRLGCLVALYKVPKDTEHKISIVKAVRDFTGCDLRTTVDIVNAAQNGSRTSFSSTQYPYVQQILHPDRSKGDDRSYHQRANDLLHTLLDLDCVAYLASE